MFTRNIFLQLLLTVSISWITQAAIGQALPPGFSYSTIGSGWAEPVGTTFNSTGTKLFVWEKGGKVFVCNWDGSNYVKQTTPVINISEEVGNWRDHGLLGFELDPNFDVNGLIYLLYVVDRHHLLNYGLPSYNANTNNYLSATIGRLTRYQTTVSSGNLVAITGSRTILIGETKTTGIPILYESHGVGSLAFASDGTLLVSAGDAASYTALDVGSQPETYYAQALADGIIRPAENVGVFRSQMLNSLDGKVLRIDPVTGNGVSSNPFYNALAPRSAQSRVWAFGLRNPFRMNVRPNTGSSNPATGDIGEVYVSDVGLSTYEEINIAKAAAANFGWPVFEGLTLMHEYDSAAYVTYNQDEPNPLFGTGGCTTPYFSFRNLLKQATFDNNATVYNPCSPATPIASPNEKRFLHRLPAIDWKHLIDSARVGVFNGTNLTIQQIGSAASGVTGVPFNGNAAIAGCWYTGNLFPASYYDTYFVADYGNNFIKNIKIQFVDKVQEVKHFETGTSEFVSVVHMSQNPLDGTIVCTDIGLGTLYRITYGGNQPPVVKMSSNVKYGPSPLNVSFTGNLSYDPDGPSVTYSWNFGDGSPASTLANPSHSFSAAGAQPQKFVVKLTVTDNLGATSVDSLIISLNNTPPNITITSPINNSTYKIGSDTAYALTALVTDNEHSPAQLSYVWQTILRHNTHQHFEPLDTNRNTESVISRIGCNGDNYYWFFKLTVTDAAGLSSTDSAKLFPQCVPLPLKLNSFTVSTQGLSNLLSWTTSDEVNLRGFDIERSYDGANFSRIGSVNAGKNSYQFPDNDFLDGYIYYRLKMIDADGNFAYSFIVRIFTGNKTGSGITVSPNPFKNEFLCAAIFAETGKITARILDAKGTVMKVFSQQVEKGFYSFTVENLDNLSKGVYFLELMENGNTRRVKLVKTD